MPIECDEILKISFIKYLKAQSMELAKSLHSTVSIRSNLKILSYKIRIVGKNKRMGTKYSIIIPPEPLAIFSCRPFH